MKKKKRYRICRKTRNVEEVLVFCNKCYDNSIKNGYEEECRKISTPKPKIDNALVTNFLNFDINNIENENIKISLIIA